jgi:hypothetical protein
VDGLQEAMEMAKFLGFPAQALADVQRLNDGVLTEADAEEDGAVEAAANEDGE